MSNMADDKHKVTLLAPVDIVATATFSNFLNLAKAKGLVELIIPFGVVTSTDSTGEVVVTVVADAVNDTSSSDTIAAAVAFEYRLSGAVGTDTMGALTAATSAGYALINTDDAKTLHIFIDPAAVQLALAGAKYARVELTPTAESTVTLVAVLAEYVPNYAGASQESSS